jgi:LemA protein
MKKTLLIILGVVVVVGIYLFSSYNGMVSASETVDAQWKQVETQYQRRFDLIPNLVESAKGVMTQEKEVFGKLADARSKYAGAATPSDKAQAATEVEGALSRLLVIVENYPQLKSSENVQTLMAQLEGTENRISVERKRYNDEAKNYNIMIKRIPAAWLASIYGFSEKKYFEAQAGTEVAPKVNFQ